MRKLYIFGLIGLAALIIGLAFADQMTFTTYYPAPYGVYNNMVMMNSLGVGTTEPQAILDVSSTTSGLLLPRIEDEAARDADISPKVEGMMIYNKDKQYVEYYIGSDQWRSMPEALPLPLTDVALSSAQSGSNYFGAVMVAGVPSTGRVYVRTVNLCTTNIGNMDITGSWGNWVDFGTPDASSRLMSLHVSLSSTQSGSDYFGAIITVRMSSGNVYVRTVNLCTTNIGNMDITGSWGNWVDFGNPGL